MKDLIITIFFIIVSSTANYGQTMTMKTPNNYLKSIESVNSFASPPVNSKGKKFKKIGVALGAGGAIAIAGGVALMADAGVFSTNYFKEKMWKGASAKSIGERYIGGALVDLGTYAIAGGVVFYIIGNKKIRREKAAINFTLSPVSAGVVYRF